MATQLGMDPWAIQPRERARYEEQFRALQPVNGIVTGDQVKGFLLQSQLPPQILGQIWNLSDTDADGKMNINEFSIACKLINLKLRNFELPKTLPPCLLQQNKPPGVSMPSTNLLQNVPPAIPPLPLGGLRGSVSSIPPLHPPLSSMGPAPGIMAPLGVPPPVPSTAPLLGGSMVGGQMGVAPSVPPLIGGQMGLSSGIGGGAPLVNMAAGSGVPLLGGLPPVPSTAQLLSGLTQPVSNGTVVMGQGLPPPRPPPVIGAPAAVPGIERGPSIDSPLSLGSPLQEWSVPHQTKLKYTQLFNTSDRTRSGFLSGPQARNIMVQTQLPQPILAQIWSLSDMDADGRLSCDEFVLAMHLCDLAKAGESIPTGLPLELIPPSFRRIRQGSLQGAAPPGAVAELVEGKDAASSLPTVTFEDKRKENFDKGQAELERRRKALLEIQRKEQEERERKEKEEMEKRERIRLEQERRRQQELEKQLQKQREVEQEKEEQRKRAQEQREAARREMERQRQLEWEKQRCQELQHQRQREQEKVLSLKAKNQNLSIELSQLNEKVKELSHKISETRLGVSGVKTTIDGMRSTRDQQMADMSALKTRLKEQNQRLVSLGQEKARMEAKNRMNSSTDNASQEQVAIAFSNKQITLKQMRDRLNDLQKEIEVKLSDIENNNSQLGDLKKQLATLVQECEQLYAVYEERKRRVLEMKGVTIRQKESSDLGTSWGDSGWNTAPQTTWNTDTEPEWSSMAADTTIPAANSNFFKYRALYEFVARNGDELSFQPGDIIMVPVVQNAEPGWLAGEIRGHTGWFPESYVEPVDGALGTLALESSIGDAAPPFPPDIIGDTLQGKRPLEGIAEVPENVSDNGSVAEVVGEAGPQITDLTSPVLGQGELVDNVQTQALYNWRAKRNNHLSFNKGDIITVKEQQEFWWFGELNEAQGWFPNNYVQVAALEGAQDADFEQEYHVTLYPYHSVESGDLSFQQGEVVLVVKKEGDWWTGVIGDRQGIFPSNYVQKAEIETRIPAEEVVPNVVELVVKEEVAALVETPPVAVQAQPLQQEQPPPPSPLPAAKTPTPGTPDFAAMSAQYEDIREDEDSKRKSSSTSCQSPKGKSKKPEIATVIAPYQATSTEQLTLQRGQLIMVRKKTSTGWWEGELQAKGRKRQIGWFPASYVKLLGGGAKGRQDDQPSPLPTLQPSPSPQPQALSPPTQLNNIEKVVALYQYAAQNEDELTFEKDDVIVLLAKEEPSWWRGELNGVSGLFPSNYVSPLSTVRLSGRDKKRLDCILELISTEQAYIEDMTIVNEVFEKPLLDSKVLSASDVHKIFVNWKEIIVCNHMFLRALRVRRDMSASGVIRMIGDILCENLPRMTAYVRFCSCQLSAAKFLQQLTETSAEFREVVKRCQADPRTKGMPLSSFLIKPMQRITKYPLLIKKILEHTSEDHPDRQNVQEALAKAEEFCVQVNEGVREKENSDRLEWLQQYVVCEGLEEELIFNSLTNCLGPRKLLHFGILNKAKSGKELLGLLLNDFLLLAQPNKSLGPHGFSFDNSHSTVTFRLYKKPVFLNELQIGHDPSVANSAGDSAEVQTRTLRLQDTLTKTLHILVTPTCKERTIWLKKLKDAQEDIVDTERKHFQRQQSKQAQFGACGRILVEVVEGVGLRPGSATVRHRLPKGSLKLTVCSATSLPMQRAAGRCDAFCEVSMGSQEHRTPAVQATSEARWNTTMQFLVKDLKEDVLCITVFDRGHFSPNEFLGRTEVRVADILRETRNDHGPVNTRLQLHEVESGEISLKLDLRLFNRELCK